MNKTKIFASLALFGLVSPETKQMPEGCIENLGKFEMYNEYVALGYFAHVNDADIRKTISNDTLHWISDYHLIY